MKRIVYPPNHGSNRPRSLAKARCRECHAPASHVELEQRPAAVLGRDGSMRRFAELVQVFWCGLHTGMAS